MDHYNNSRTHQGKHGQRRTLIQTFTESFDLVKQKNLDILRYLTPINSSVGQSTSGYELQALPAS